LKWTSGTLTAMPAPARPSRLVIALLYALVVLIWGTTWIAIRSAVESVPPITASGLRFAIAFPVLAVIVAGSRAVPLRYPTGKGRLFAVVTVGYFAIPFALMNLGSAAIPSGLAAVLFSMVSLFILALSVPVLGSRITRRQAAGVGVALAALAALIGHQTGVGGGASPLGVLALLGAAGMHAVVYVVLKRDAGSMSPLTINALPMGIAALALCATGALAEHPDPSAITDTSLLALLYLGAFASVAGFLAYFHLLRHLGPVPLALVFILFPALAQLAAVAGGERPMGAGSLALLGLVLGAALVATTGGARRRPAQSAGGNPSSAKTLAVPNVVISAIAPSRTRSTSILNGVNSSAPGAR
jgi:putative membrane protein PagO